MSDTLIPGMELFDEEPREPADVTAEGAAAMGFSPEELDLLMASGVLVDERRAGPWRPETLEDVDWIVSRLKQIAREMADLERFHAARMDRLGAAYQAMRRFETDCLEITRAALPKKKDGSYAKKSLVLDRCQVKVVSSQGGPKVVDEAAVLAYVLAEGDVLGEASGIVSALRVTLTETHEGEDALPYVDVDLEGVQRTVKILHAPVKAFVESLPPEADPVTGEALPATIPGVEIVPPSDRWEWE